MADTPGTNDNPAYDADNDAAPLIPGMDRPPKQRRRKRVIIVVALSLVALICGATGSLYVIANDLAGNIHRIPGVFKGINPGGRPVMPAATRHSVTILLAGSDVRSPTQTTGAHASTAPFVPGEQRSDTLLLMHISANRQGVSLISIPRDSWVDVPGQGMMKINAALSLGGPPLMIETVEHLTHVRIDHYAVIDFAGFSGIVQALGGVDVPVARQTSTGSVTFRQGTNDLNPRTALAYVRQRDGLPGGDLSRIQRQQALIRAILAKIASLHLVTSPLTVYHLLDALTHAISVDSTFTTAQMRSLALQLAGLHGSDFTFLTAPVRGLGWQDGQSVVFLNASQCATLWHSVRHDSVAAWARRHPATVTPSMPY